MIYKSHKSVTLLAGIGLLSMALALPVLAGGGSDIVRNAALFGQDNDNIDNPVIQPDGVEVNQSLDNADILQGFDGNDTLIGMLGSDTIVGDTGNDITMGGPEGFVAPNKDMILGGSGNDTNIWAPGDGSDFFDGGEGSRDAQVFGPVDLDDEGRPILTPMPGHLRNGAPSVNVSGSPGFCRLERVETKEGFEYLVRFFVRASGNLAVTVRLNKVEQVFCTNESGTSITYANLRAPNADFVDILLSDVKALNPDVAQMIR